VLALLSTTSQTDASLILARQLIAAKLNVANGSDPTPIASIITHADALLAGYAGKLPYNVKAVLAHGSIDDGGRQGARELQPGAPDSRVHSLIPPPPTGGERHGGGPNARRRS